MWYKLKFYFQIGDHIEKIDDECLVGRRHFEVAKMLKDIPVGTTFTLRLIGPMKAGFGNYFNFLRLCYGMYLSFVLNYS